jgi:hypothetical protein
MACSECREQVREADDIALPEDVGQVAVVADVAVVELYDISLHQAARLYHVSLTTLRRRVRWGEIFAYKTRGPWGDEWRVSGPALEAYGFRRRAVTAGETPLEDRVASLEREIATLRRLVTLHRERADQADRELGAAMLECGRLQAALEAARGEVDEQK